MMSIKFKEWLKETKENTVDKDVLKVLEEMEEDDSDSDVSLKAVLGGTLLTLEHCLEKKDRRKM